MSEKQRAKKDGENKSKNNQRLKQTSNDADKKTAAFSRQDKAGRGMGKQ